MQTPGTATDEVLLAAAATGDPEAVRRLVDRHVGRVFGLAITVLADRGMAEDAVQESFLRVWRFAAGFDARRGSGRTWILAITRNVCVDLARAGARRRSVPVDADVLADLLGGDPSPGPAERYLADEDRTRLRAALLTLPVTQQRALLLARWHGLSATEIAATEGIPLGTAKSRLRLGLQGLRRALLDNARSDTRPGTDAASGDGGARP